MHKIILICILFYTITGYGQGKPGQKKQVVKKETTTFKTDPRSDGNYHLSDIVKIENGEGENVDVVFTASVPFEIWDSVSKRFSHSGKKYFSFISNLLSIQARHTLKNNLSFEPFSKQFFSFIDGRFVCDYKMMGRNGYGNLVETSSLVVYNPYTGSESMQENTDSIKAPVIDLFKKHDQANKKN